MTNGRKRSALTAFVITGTVILILSIAQGFKGFNDISNDGVRLSDTLYNIQSYKLPENVTFAGEKMRKKGISVDCICYNGNRYSNFVNRTGV